jgi:hypothetical protein
MADADNNDSQTDETGNGTSGDATDTTGSGTDTDTDASASADTDQTGDQDDADDDSPEELDLERALAKIAKTNSEAKNLREAKKKLEAELAAAKPLLEAEAKRKEAEKTDLQKALEEIERLKTEGNASARSTAETVAKEKLKLTDAQLAALPGNSYKEIEEAYKAQQKLWSKGDDVPDPDALSGGRNGSTGGKSTPVEQGIQAGKNVRLW